LEEAFGARLDDGVRDRAIGAERVAAGYSLRHGDLV